MPENYKKQNKIRLINIKLQIAHNKTYADQKVKAFKS